LAESERTDEAPVSLPRVPACEAKKLEIRANMLHRKISRLLSKTRGAIEILTLNRPAEFNAILPGMMAELTGGSQRWWLK
jgi:hypothetical protein